MSSDRDKTVSRDDDLELCALLDAALDLPPEQWRAYLEANASRPELARAAEDLLRAEEGLEDILDEPMAPMPMPPTDPVGGSAPETPSRLAPETLLAGRYRIVAWIGGGGGGDVYRAEDRTLGDDVALKVLPPTDTSELRLRYLRAEVRIARQVAHPNVCRVFDVGESDGLHFLTMERIEGEDLAVLLRRDVALSLARAAEIGAQICDGLAAVHAKGILHRDLKPANVIIDPADDVRLVDFGVAGFEGDATIGGTPLYMAPELFEGQVATVQSELYALGLILYQLFTGQRAIRGRSAATIERQHREESPTPPSEHCPGLSSTLEQTLLRCLEKRPAARPSSAAAVASALRGGEVPAESRAGVALRPWSPPTLPSEPYPLLLPYRHPKLLAGRSEEIDGLQRWLQLPRPIVGLSAPSGTGKSSLLQGGLYPTLRAAGRPVVLDRHPAEPGLAGRLLEGLLDVPGGLAIVDRDPASFVALLEQAEKLADGRPPVLIVDQVEDLFRRPEARRARAVLGLLLAATCRRRPGREAPVCRWLLAYREEYFGELRTWLRDVLADAESLALTTDSSEWRSLPRDLSDLDRFQAWSLTPLATPSPAAEDPLSEATEVFRQAIEAPLEQLGDDGSLRYPWRFKGGGADRLARAFAETRLARPGAPLAPELQVVLAHLQSNSERQGTAGRAAQEWVIEVPEDVASTIDRALEAHLRRCLERTFPAARGVAQRRARALLALRELAGRTGRSEAAAVPESDLARALGDEGRQILEQLSGPATRLVVASVGPDGRRWQLSHDRLAETVTRLVDEEGRSGGLLIDSELLALRQRVSLQSALHASGESTATNLSGRVFRRIRDHADALLWDPERRAWWQACRRLRRRSLLRRSAFSLLTLILLAVVGLGIRATVERQAQRTAILEQIEVGSADAAAAALASALANSDPRFTANELLAALRLRERPFDVLDRGLGGLTEARRADQILDIGELILPLIEEVPADPADPREIRLASLLWALDYSPMRDPDRVDRALHLRERALAPLWIAHPPPDLEGEPWIELPGGTFRRGGSPVMEDDESTGEPSGQQVTISPLQMFAREVTKEEYRRLVPGHRGDDPLPAHPVNWYQAYVYAAWLGGPSATRRHITRLPTDAEWEYAARSGCQLIRCTTDGQEIELDEFAWWAGNSMDADGEHQVKPVALLAPNQNGLYDLFGNVLEWVAEWPGVIPETPERDPVGPVVIEPAYRILRGGGVGASSPRMHSGHRTASYPENLRGPFGIRPVRVLIR